MRQKSADILGHRKVTCNSGKPRAFLAKDEAQARPFPHACACIRSFTIRAVLGHSAIKCQEARSETGEAYLPLSSTFFNEPNPSFNLGPSLVVFADAVPLRTLVR